MVLPIGGRTRPKLKLILMMVFAASNAAARQGFRETVMQASRQLFET
jgi:hypothetical protein